MFKNIPNVLMDSLLKLKLVKATLGLIGSTFVMLTTGAIGGLLNISSDVSLLTWLAPPALLAGYGAITRKSTKTRGDIVLGIAAILALIILFVLGLNYMYTQAPMKYIAYVSWCALNIVGLLTVWLLLSSKKQEITQKVVQDVQKSVGLQMPDSLKHQSGDKQQPTIPWVVPNVDFEDERVKNILNTAAKNSKTFKRPQSKKR